ncbi:hypothetical protein [Lactobacillus amylovorus]|uniref:hypothetical protein n=1 Tax=Lactobacillus amylovorus TaxID=1604 RepID=UPI000E5117F4|nr:hypothetical protein [Lactobacillus amylovorus]RGW83703.1 hypothetical protein DWV49_07170 [Lactobacillus amylovorus]
MSSDLDKRVEEFFRTYQDRGMKKWAGFYLSDYTAKINKDKKRRNTVYIKKKNNADCKIKLNTLEK